MRMPFRTLFAMLFLPLVVAGCTGTRTDDSGAADTAADIAATAAARASEATPVIPNDLLVESYSALQPTVTKTSDGNDTYIARFPKAAQSDSSGASTALACVAAYMAAESGRPGFSLLGGFSRDKAGFFTALFSLDERSNAIDPREVEVSTTGNACSDVVRPRYRWN